MIWIILGGWFGTEDVMDVEGVTLAQEELIGYRYGLGGILE